MKPDSTQAVFETLNKTLDIPSNLRGFDYLKQLCDNLWQAFQFEYIVIGYAEETNETHVETIINLVEGQQQPNFRYDLKDTPCQGVFEGDRICFYPDNIAQRFPKDLMLKEMGAESYIGAPTIFEGRIAGLLAVLSRRPLEEDPALKQMMEFLAARIAIELERFDLNQVIQSAVQSETKQIRHQNDMLRRQIEEDPITGTYTPERFLDKTNQWLETHLQSSLVQLCINNFHSLHETEGRLDCEKLLVQLANQLKTLPDIQFTAYLGQGEFLLLTQLTQREALHQLSVFLHQNAAQIPVKTQPVTLSLGIAQQLPKENLIQLLKKVEDTAYIAKQSGRSITVYSDSA